MKENTPSSTAMIVAKNIAVIAASHHTAHFVAPDAVRLNSLLIIKSSAGGEHFLKTVSSRWFQNLFRFYERLTIRGLALHQALRKLHIERAVRESLAGGFRQVVILGGGLDTLALRLHSEFPGVNFLEIDHPATQQVKREIPTELHGPNLKLLAVDLTGKTLEETLYDCSDYRQNAPTVFICEGVLMYLEAAEVEIIFRFIENQNGAQRFIFTFMEAAEKEKIGFRHSTFLVRLWLAMKKEPFKWGLSSATLSNFLAEHGFSLKELTTAETFRQSYLKEFDLNGQAIAEGENLCVCEKSAL